MLQVVSVTFNQMRLEDGPECECECDNVLIYDDNFVEKFCSSAYPITSTGPSLHVFFTTDGSVNKGGFSLNWKFVSQGWYSSGCRSLPPLLASRAKCRPTTSYQSCLSLLLKYKEAN